MIYEDKILQCNVSQLERMNQSVTFTFHLFDFSFHLDSGCVKCSISAVAVSGSVSDCELAGVKKATAVHCTHVLLLLRAIRAHTNRLRLCLCLCLCFCLCLCDCRCMYLHLSTPHKSTYNQGWPLPSQCVSCVELLSHRPY